MSKIKVLRILWQPSTPQIMKNQKQPENVAHFSYLGSMVTNNARGTREIKSTIDVTKAAFNKEKNLFTSKLDLNLTKKLLTL
jgi:hypothetical protein